MNIDYDENGGYDNGAYSGNYGNNDYSGLALAGREGGGV